MSIVYQTRWTKKGAEKIQNALLTESKLKVVALVVGGVAQAGTHPPTLDDFAQELPNEIYEIPVQSVEQDNYNSNRILYIGVIPHISEGGYYLNVAGLIDEDGDLVAQATIPETYKPFLDQNASKNIEVRLGMVTATPQALSLELSADRYVTEEDVNNIVVEVIPELITQELGKRDLVERTELDLSMARLRQSLNTNLEENYWSKENQAAVFLTRQRAADFGIDQDLGSTEGNNNLDYEGVDLNFIIKSGEYRFDSRAKNIPCPNGLMKVWRSDQTTVCQIVQDLGSDPEDPNRGSMYSRSMYLNGAWTEWTGTRKVLMDFIEKFLHVGSWHGTHNMIYDPMVDLAPFFGYNTSWMLVEGLQTGVSKDEPTDVYLGGLAPNPNGGPTQESVTTSRIWKRLPNNTEAPTYSLRIFPEDAILVENKQYRVILETLNVAEGKILPWSSTGTIDVSDIQGSGLNGNFVVGADGTAFFDFKTTDDMKEEGNEFWTIYLNQQPEVKLDLTISDTSFFPTAQAYISATQDGYTTPLASIEEGGKFWLSVLARIPTTAQNNFLNIEYAGGENVFVGAPTQILSQGTGQILYQYEITSQSNAVPSGAPFITIQTKIKYTNATTSQTTELSQAQIIISNSEEVDIWQGASLVWKALNNNGVETVITNGEYVRNAGYSTMLMLEATLPYAAPGTVVYLGTWASGSALAIWNNGPIPKDNFDFPHPTLPNVRYRAVRAVVGVNFKAYISVYVDAANTSNKMLAAVRGFATFRADLTPQELEEIVFNDANLIKDLRVNQNANDQIIWIDRDMPNGTNMVPATIDLDAEYYRKTGVTAKEGGAIRQVTFGVRENVFIRPSFVARNSKPQDDNTLINFGEWNAGSEINLVNYGTVKGVPAPTPDAGGTAFYTSSAQVEGLVRREDAPTARIDIPAGGMVYVALYGGSGGAGGSVYSPSAPPNGTDGGTTLATIYQRRQGDSSAIPVPHATVPALGGKAGTGGVWGNGSSYTNGANGYGGIFSPPGYSLGWDMEFYEIMGLSGETPLWNPNDRWTKAPTGVQLIPYVPVPNLVTSYTDQVITLAQGRSMDIVLVGAGAGAGARYNMSVAQAGGDGQNTVMSIAGVTWIAGGGKGGRPYTYMSEGGAGGTVTLPASTTGLPNGVTVTVIDSKAGESSLQTNNTKVQSIGGAPSPLGIQRLIGRGGDGPINAGSLLEATATGGGAGARIRVRVRNTSNASVNITVRAGAGGQPGTGSNGSGLSGNHGAIAYGAPDFLENHILNNVVVKGGDGGRGIGDEYWSYGGAGGNGAQVHFRYKNDTADPAYILINLGDIGKGGAGGGRSGTDGTGGVAYWKIDEGASNIKSSVFNFGQVRLKADIQDFVPIVQDMYWATDYDGLYPITKANPWGGPAYLIIKTTTAGKPLTLELSSVGLVQADMIEGQLNTTVTIPLRATASPTTFIGSYLVKTTNGA